MPLYLKMDQKTWVSGDYTNSASFDLSGTVYDENTFTTTRDISGCTVLLRLIDGKTSFEKLLGKSMVCTVLTDDRGFPEENLNDCSGPLREEYQELIIQRMHNYLIENIGQINDEFNKLN